MFAILAELGNKSLFSQVMQQLALHFAQFCAVYSITLSKEFMFIWYPIAVLCFCSFTSFFFLISRSSHRKL